jgi:hypothetical protein
MTGSMHHITTARLLGGPPMRVRRLTNCLKACHNEQRIGHGHAARLSLPHAVNLLNNRIV